MKFLKGSVPAPINMDNIYIRKANLGDFDAVMQIYAQAREFMRKNGNPDQWGDYYPPAETVKEDLFENGGGYVVTDEKNILAAFYFEQSADDPTYREIFGGEWINDLPYGVVHRVGVGELGRGKGIGCLCLSWALSAAGNLKIDTHVKNLPMQRLLEKLGFVRCGSIYLEDGSHRLAYQCVLKER